MIAKNSIELTFDTREFSPPKGFEEYPHIIFDKSLTINKYAIVEMVKERTKELDHYRVYCFFNDKVKLAWRTKKESELGLENFFNKDLTNKNF